MNCKCPRPAPSHIDGQGIRVEVCTKCRHIEIIGKYDIKPSDIMIHVDVPGYVPMSFNPLDDKMTKD